MCGADCPGKKIMNEAFLNIGNRVIIRRSNIVGIVLFCKEEILSGLGPVSFFWKPSERPSFSINIRQAHGDQIDLPFLTEDKEAALKDWEKLQSWYTCGEGMYLLHSKESLAEAKAQEEATNA